MTGATERNDGLAHLRAANLGGPEALATFVCSRPGMQQRVQPVFSVTATDVFEAKELLCQAFPCSADGSVIRSKTSWPYSRNLQSPFAYFPAFAGQELVTLRPFELEEGFQLLVLAVRPWTRDLSGLDVSIDACLDFGTVGVDGAQLPVYRPATPLNGSGVVQP